MLRSVQLSTMALGNAPQHVGDLGFHLARTLQQGLRLKRNVLWLHGAQTRGRRLRRVDQACLLERVKRVPP